MTARSLAWDGLVIGGVFVLLYGGTTLVAFALIGTLDRDEVRPVLAVMSWWRAHRLPLLGLLFPGRGRHAVGDGWHPLDDDEEAGDEDGADISDEEIDRMIEKHFADGHEHPGRRCPYDPPRPGDDLSGHHDDWAAGRLTHAGEDDEEETDARMPRSGMRRADPVRDAGLPPPLVPGAEGGQERGLRGVEGRRGSGHAGAPERDEPRDRGDDAAADADDDLSGLSPEDTDTLRAIRALNAEHLVPTNEPQGCDTCGGVRDCDLLCPEGAPGVVLPRLTEDHPGPAPGMDVDTSSGHGPGADVRQERQDGQRSDALDDRGPGSAVNGASADPPGPDGAGDLTPVTTAACPAAANRPVKADSPGPGDHPPARQPGTGSGEPGAQAAARRPLRRLPAAALAMVRRDGPARFWTAANMSECAQTAALLALADSILAGGAA